MEPLVTGAAGCIGSRCHRGGLPLHVVMTDLDTGTLLRPTLGQCLAGSAS